MKISLVEVAGANFRTSEKSDELNTTFKNRLGMRKRYLPARLAISRSLAIPSVPPELDESADGKVIKGDALFGTGATLATWTALIIEHSDRQDIDTRKLVELVAAHWHRGLEILDREWKQADKDIANFVTRIVEASDLPFSTKETPGGYTPDTDDTLSIGLIQVPVGEVAEDVNSGNKILWEMNGAGGSPHSAIMGGVGSGKTRTAVAMLKAIREQASVPIIAFDFKGDLGTDSAGKGYHIDKFFDARILEPPREPIPLDVLSFKASDNQEIDISEAASRFRESFGRLKGGNLGARQRPLVHEAATNALKMHEQCELHHIQDALKNLYEEREFTEDGATSTMDEICRFPLFRPEFKPETFFKKSWLIKLPPNVAEDSRTIVVNLMLDALDQYLNSLNDTSCDSDGARGLRILCMVDEAHRILSSKLPSLSSLIRLSRSKGGSLMLISQSPDDFKGEDDEFLSEMGLVAAFSTNAPPRNATRILGKGAKLSALKNGQCFVKLRGEQSARKVCAWNEGRFTDG